MYIFAKNIIEKLLNMKKLRFITLIIWVVSIPIIFLFVNLYVDHKDERLRTEINDKIEEIFKGREYIDVVYSGKKVSYEKETLPKKPQKSSSIIAGEYIYEREISSWRDKYSDLYKIYKINKNNNSYGEEDNGWELIKMSSNLDSKGNWMFVKQWLFPYAVGYKKAGQSLFGYDFAPSVESAVYDAFNSFTSNSNSNKYNKFEKGSFDRIHHEIFEARNEYYIMSEDSIPRIDFTGETLWGKPKKYDRERVVSNLLYTYMHNGIYRVFIGTTQPTTWSLVRLDKVINKDKNNILMWWLISTGSFFIIIITILSILLQRKNKRINESDYEKLIRLSHPKNFMNPYDKEKVEKANLIYKEVETVDKNNTEAVNVLILRCIDELGITFIDKTQLSELKKFVSPNRFMKPYDAQKIQLANQLFSKLNSDNLSYMDFKEICEKAKELNS